MTLFLFLLAVCAAGGLLVTALIWVFFWLVGIFEIPLTIKKLFGIAVTKNYGLTRPDSTMFSSIYKGQAGIVRANIFGMPEGSLFRPAYSINSASASKSLLNVTLDRQNQGQAHGIPGN